MISLTSLSEFLLLDLGLTKNDVCIFGCFLLKSKLIGHVGTVHDRWSANTFHKFVKSMYCLSKLTRDI